jgi:hypothetical protein
MVTSFANSLSTETCTAQVRVWTAKSGHTVRANYLGRENDKTVVLETEGGQIIKVAKSQFIAADQEFIRSKCVRLWTIDGWAAVDSYGRFRQQKTWTIEAELIGLDDTGVKLRDLAGKTARVPLTALDIGEQAHAFAWIDTWRRELDSKNNRFIEPLSFSWDDSPLDVVQKIRERYEPRFVALGTSDALARVEISRNLQQWRHPFDGLDGGAQEITNSDNADILSLIAPSSFPNSVNAIPTHDAIADDTRIDDGLSDDELWEDDAWNDILDQVLNERPSTQKTTRIIWTDVFGSEKGLVMVHPSNHSSRSDSDFVAIKAGPVVFLGSEGDLTVTFGLYPGLVLLQPWMVPKHDQTYVPFMLMKVQFRGVGFNFDRTTIEQLEKEYSSLDRTTISTRTGRL